MEPFEICKDVYQVGGSSLTSPDDCSIYLVDGGSELVLIDSGTGRSFEKIVKNIERLGLSPRNLKYIIATHAHIDHIGSLARFKEEFNSRILAHKLDSEGIETGIGVGAHWYGVIYKPCPVDIKIDRDQEELSVGKHVLKLLHIPGHTPGSIACYIDIAGKRVLFGQDIHGPYHLPGGDRKMAKFSLKKLLDLRADILCEGHFGIFEPKEEVKSYIERYISQL